MDSGSTSASTSSLQDSNYLNYFPSAVLESPESPVIEQQLQRASSPPKDCSEKFQVKIEQTKDSEATMALVISIGPSREPVPLMRYEFYKSSSASKSEESDHELIIKSKTIQTKFSNLILDTCSLLQDSSRAYIEKLQMWLSYQSCSKSAQILKAFDRESDALKAKTIPVFISSLRCYTSWYNYGLIANIARQFCGTKGAALVTAYEAELKDYLQSLILHCPPLFPGHEDSSHSWSTDLLEIKVGGWEASTATLEDIALFKHTLCELCDLDHRFLVIREIDTTNFTMSWAVPKVAIGKLTKSIKVNSDALRRKCRVQSIKTADLDINFQESKAGKGLQLQKCTELPKRINASKSFAGRSLFTVGNSNAHTRKYRTSDVADDVFDAAGRQTLQDSNSTDLRKHAHEETRASRDRKALSLGTTLPRDILGQSSLLSEITKTLKVANLLSPESVVKAPSSRQVSKSTNEKDESVGSLSLHDEVFFDTGQLGTTGDVLSTADINGVKSVSFLWRILGRAKPNFHANVHIVSIQATEIDDIQVRRGQQLKALYRKSDKVRVQNLALEEGFVPYSLCRLSRKHYGPQSKLIQLSYLRLYPQSPDGIDTLPTDQIPNIKMVAIRNHFPSSHEELSMQIGQSFTILYCDMEWIYATSNKSSGLLPRSTCELAPDSREHFKQWDHQPFQSDFIMRYDEPRPEILHKSPLPVVLKSVRTGSKVGKMFTVIQNFVPTSPTSGTFTIRKGLKVRVVEESGLQVCVITKTGNSFWIPQNHVRPARKNSMARNNSAAA